MFVLMVAEKMGLNQVTHLLAGRGIHKMRSGEVDSVIDVPGHKGSVMVLT